MKVHVDAQATVGPSHGAGLGKARHIETAELWIQDALAHQELPRAMSHQSTFNSQPNSNIFGRVRPTLAEIAENFGRTTSTTIGQLEGPNAAKFGMDSAKFDKTMLGIDQIGPGAAEMCSHSATVGRGSTTTGRDRPGIDQDWCGIDQTWPVLSNLDRIRPK